MRQAASQLGLWWTLVLASFSSIRAEDPPTKLEYKSEKITVWVDFAFSPNDEKIAGLSEITLPVEDSPVSSQITIWNAKTAKLEKTFAEQPVQDNWVAWSQDGNLILSADREAEAAAVRIWDVATGKFQSTLKFPEKPLWNLYRPYVFLTPDSRFILMLIEGTKHLNGVPFSFGKKIICVELRTGKEVWSVDGISALSSDLSPDGTTLAVGMDNDFKDAPRTVDGAVFKIRDAVNSYDVATGKRRRGYDGPFDVAPWVILHDHRTPTLIVSTLGGFNTLDLKTSEWRKVRRQPESWKDIGDPVLSRDRKQLCVRDFFYLHLLDFENGQLLRTVDLESREIRPIGISHDCRRGAFATFEGGPQIQDLNKLMKSPGDE